MVLASVQEPASWSPTWSQATRLWSTRHHSASPASPTARIRGRTRWRADATTGGSLRPGGPLSFFRQPGGADTGDVYRFPPVAQRWGAQRGIGSVACNVRITIRACHLQRFREFGSGEFPLAFETV